MTGAHLIMQDIDGYNGNVPYNDPFELTWTASGSCDDGAGTMAWGFTLLAAKSLPAGRGVT